MSSSCTPSSPLPGQLREIVEDKSYLVLYGPPATGKTRVAFELARQALSQGMNAVVLATEPGTLTYARFVVTCVPTVRALSISELIDALVEYAAAGWFIVVDSINWPFRGYVTPENLTILSSLSAILRRTGGAAVGQVTEEGEEMALGRWVLPWAHVIARSQRVPCGGRPCSAISFVKPPRGTLTFELTSDGVRWTTG